METTSGPITRVNTFEDSSPIPARRMRLGEELPVFCEQCGYALHGLPTVRCEHCALLHFRCPECGHTQPINTLRPAVQRTLGRIRAWILGFWVLVKINFFFWLLFAWLAMGYEWSYTYRVTAHVTAVKGGVMAYAAGGSGGQRRQYYIPEPRPIDLESIVVFSLFALSFGTVSRMLLLRWRSSLAVGLVLATLVVLAILGGALFRQYEREIGASPINATLCTLLALTGGWLAFGAMVVFPVWSGLVRLFLPKRAASALLDWQTGRQELMCSQESPKPAVT